VEGKGGRERDGMDRRGGTGDEGRGKERK